MQAMWARPPPRAMAKGGFWEAREIAESWLLSPHSEHVSIVTKKKYWFLKPQVVLSFFLSYYRAA